MLINRDAAILHYQFYSRLFFQKTTLEDLHKYLDFIEESFPHEESYLWEMHDFFKTWLEKENSESLEKRLNSEFTYLFHLWDGVRPYESVYRGKEPLLKQEPWVEVKNFYAKRGWYMDKQAFLEDHVSVEMSFMAHLLVEGEYEDARDFFLQHLGRWIPELMRDISQNRYADFYRVVSGYCLSFLEEERKYYEEY